MPEDRVIELETPGVTAEANVYSAVYRVLLGGMFISSALFAIGIVSALVHPRAIPLTPEWVQQQYRVHTVLNGLIHLDATSLMLVATVLLILTPVTRVVVSIYAFAVDRDRKYVFVTGIVFLVMILTVILGVLGLK